MGIRKGFDVYGLRVEWDGR